MSASFNDMNRMTRRTFFKSLHATGKPVILINCSGSALAIPWEHKKLPAIVQAWYPGEEGGTAVAQVLFGEVNPAGQSQRVTLTLDPQTAFRSWDATRHQYVVQSRDYKLLIGGASDNLRLTVPGT